MHPGRPASAALGDRALDEIVTAPWWLGLAGELGAAVLRELRAALDARAEDRGRAQADRVAAETYYWLRERGLPVPRETAEAAERWIHRRRS